jgi:hypothetical protein
MPRHVTVLTRKVANGTGSQSLEQYSPVVPLDHGLYEIIQEYFWEPKRGANYQIKLYRELVMSGGVGVSGSSRLAQIELTEISLRGCLLDADAPCIGTPRYRLQIHQSTCNESTPVSEFFASSTCPTRGYRYSWLVRSRRRVSHSSQDSQTRTDIWALVTLITHVVRHPGHKHPHRGHQLAHIRGT